MKPEGAALDSFELKLSHVETYVEGDFAWAVADVEFKAMVKRDQRKLRSRGYETHQFRRVDGKWMIIHTHSSSSPVKEN